MTTSGCQNEGFGQKEPSDERNDGTAQISDTADQSGSSYFEIETDQGNMIIRLYDATPIHRDNFIKLVSEGFFDGTTFHRVIPGFMIQGGDPNSKDDDPTNDGMGGPGYTLPAEFNPALFHKKGALAAARTGGPSNPEKESSGSQFYIVEGQVVENAFLDQIEARQQSQLSPDYKVQDAAREVYTTVGGTPFLDMDYTVFGELVEGFDVLERIARVDTPASVSQQQGNDRPIENVTMRIKPLPNYSPK